MSSSSSASPAAIVRLLDLVENNTKALPYPDVEGFEKFTGLATVAMESMVSPVLFVLVRYDAQTWRSDMSNAISSPCRPHAILPVGQEPPKRYWSGN